MVEYGRVEPTEAKRDAVHDVDGDMVGMFAGDFGIEEEEGVFDGPVADEVEGV